MTNDDKSQGKAEPATGSAFASLITDELIEMKARELKVLDLQGLTDITDFLVIATGYTERQIYAMADAIEKVVEEADRALVGIQGEKASGWMVVDTGDVVTHLLTQEMRDYYDLDSLWADAKVVRAVGEDGEDKS